MSFITRKLGVRSMRELTKVEETILIAIWQLGDAAYGVTIKDRIYDLTGREYLYNTLYTSLEQMVRKGLISKYFGDPTPVRGGKRKIFFTVTDEGLEALKEAYEKVQSLWQSVSLNSLKNG